MSNALSLDKTARSAYRGQYSARRYRSSRSFCKNSHQLNKQRTKDPTKVIFAQKMAILLTCARRAYTLPKLHRRWRSATANVISNYAQRLRPILRCGRPFLDSFFTFHFCLSQKQSKGTEMDPVTKISTCGGSRSQKTPIQDHYPNLKATFTDLVAKDFSVGMQFLS